MPEEMEIDEALEVLKKHGFKDVTEEANKQNKANNTWVFEDPSGTGLYYCDEEFEVLDIVQELQEWLEEGEEKDRRAWEADMKDMAQIKREWEAYRHDGDETPPWNKRYVNLI